LLLQETAQRLLINERNAWILAGAVIHGAIVAHSPNRRRGGLGYGTCVFGGV
jgi:hypothetical protein